MTPFQLIILVFGALCVLAILTTYVLYPLTMALWSSLTRRSRHMDDDYIPEAAMVVAAYNEEDILEEKIRNFLSIDYPEGKLTLYIGSDGSSDGTNAILERLSDGVRVRGFVFERGGKMKTVNRIVEKIQAPYLIFSDANTMYHPEAARKLLRHFADASIGGVCGKLNLKAINESAGGRGERSYWSLENMLKEWEGNTVTTLGATGGIYAIRRELYIDQPEEGQVADDFLLPLRILARGSRFVFDREATAHEFTMPSMKLEFRRKIRVAVGTFNTVFNIRPLLKDLPLTVKLMLFAHKVLRWLVPFFLIGLLLSAALLTSIPWVFDYVLVPVLVFGGWAAIAFVAELFGKRLGVFSLPFYFLAINTALLIGWFRLASHPTVATWEKSTGQNADRKTKDV